MTGADLAGALQKAGFVVTRRRGSHVQLRRGILRLAKLDTGRLTDLL